MDTLTCTPNCIGLHISTKALESAETPYQMIYAISKDDQAWHVLLNRSSKIIKGREARPEELPTSCLINYCALSLLFLGKEIALKINGDILNYTQHLSLRLNNLEAYENAIRKASYMSGNPYRPNLALKNYDRERNIRFHDVLSGLLIDANINDGSNIQDRASEYGYKLSSNINEINEPRFLNYNATVIERLFKETLNAEKDVNIENSVFYNIVITSPVQTDFMLEEHILRSDDVQYYHCFIIEQYFNAKTTSVDYMPYHGWQKKFDLQQYFSRINCTETNPTAFNRGLFEEFLSNLKTSLSPLDQPQEPEQIEQFRKITEAATAKCFTVSERLPLPSGLYFNCFTNTISGLTLRYRATKISPVQCKQNILSTFAEIMSDQ